MVQEIAFVPHQNLWDFVSTVQYQLLQPHFGIVEGLFICDIKNNACGLGKVEVVINDGSESLLSGGVPQLKGEGRILIGDVFEFVIHTDGCFLRYVLAVNVTEKESAFTNCGFADNDSFKRFHIQTV